MLGDTDPTYDVASVIIRLSIICGEAVAQEDGSQYILRPRPIRAAACRQPRAQCEGTCTVLYMYIRRASMGPPPRATAYMY